MGVMRDKEMASESFDPIPGWLQKIHLLFVIGFMVVALFLSAHVPGIDRG